MRAVDDDEPRPPASNHRRLGVAAAVVGVAVGLAFTSTDGAAQGCFTAQACFPIPIALPYYAALAVLIYTAATWWIHGPGHDRAVWTRAAVAMLWAFVLVVVPVAVATSMVLAPDAVAVDPWPTTAVFVAVWLVQASAAVALTDLVQPGSQ